MNNHHLLYDTFSLHNSFFHHDLFSLPYNVLLHTEYIFSLHHKTFFCYSSYLPIEIINRILRQNHVVSRSRTHRLNGTGNPSLAIIPLSFTIKIPILGKNGPIVQCVHDTITRNVFIFFFYIDKDT